MADELSQGLDMDGDSMGLGDGNILVLEEDEEDDEMDQEETTAAEDAAATPTNDPGAQGQADNNPADDKDGEDEDGDGDVGGEADGEQSAAETEGWEPEAANEGSQPAQENEATDAVETVFAGEDDGNPPVPENLDAQKTLVLKGLPISATSENGSKFVEAVKEIISDVFGLTDDALTDIYRQPVLTADGVELDVEAVMVFRSRIHRNRVFTQRSKLEDPLEITLFEAKKAAEPEGPTPVPVPETPAVSTGKGGSTRQVSIGTPPPADADSDDDDCIEILDVVKKDVVDFSGAPEFQWRRLRNEDQRFRLTILNATMETMRHPLVYRWVLVSHNCFLAFNSQSLAGEDHSVLLHGRLTLNFRSATMPMDAAVQSLVHYRSPPGHPRLRVLLPDTEENQDRAGELEERLGHVKRCGKRSRQLLIQSIGKDLTEVVLRRLIGGSLEKVEIVNDVTGNRCAVLTFANPRAAVEYHLFRPEMELGKELPSQEDDVPGFKRREVSKLLYMPDIIPRAWVLRSSVAEVKRQVGAHRLLTEPEPEEEEENLLEVHDFGNLAVHASSGLAGAKAAQGLKAAGERDEEEEETRASLAAQKRANQLQNKKRGRKGDGLDPDDPEAKRAAAISDSGWRGRGGFRGGPRGRGVFSGSLFGSRGALRPTPPTLGPWAHGGPPGHGGGPPPPNPAMLAEQRDLQDRLASQDQVIQELAAELARQKNRQSVREDLATAQGSGFGGLAEMRAAAAREAQRERAAAAYQGYGREEPRW